jgi:UDPglucose 6-dehydrogenase
VDQVEEKVQRLNDGSIPIFEPGLEELVQNNLHAGKLTFTPDTARAVRESEIVFITVGTPTREDGDADLTAVASVAEEVAEGLLDYRLIVEKSTVPVRTGERVRQVIQLVTRSVADFDVACNPEFLREGSAIQDFMHPDRIVLGVESERAERLLRELYSGFDCPILVTDLATAELIKHASNAFLALKISYINAIATVCERVGADVQLVAAGMGYDRRIGRAFLDAGVGYGGSCFPKDLTAFIKIAEELGYDFRLLREVQRINTEQREQVIRRLQQVIWVLRGRTIALLGVSFKPNTDDVRGSPAVEIARSLLREGATVKVYDPAAMRNFVQEVPAVKVCRDAYEATAGADALLVLTAWEEFRQLDLGRIKVGLRQPVVIDGRNFFDPVIMRSMGFQYQGFGR